MLQCHKLFQAIQEELGNKDDMKDGLSFLDMKNDTLLSYMIDVCNIVLHKVRGESIEGHHSVERCVEYRVTLEKIKAIDQKLAYQLNKLITLPENSEEGNGGIDVNNLDINLDNLATDAEDNENDSSNGDSDDNDDEEIDDDASNDDKEHDRSDENSYIDDDDETESEEDKIVQRRRPIKELVKRPKKSVPIDSQSGVYKPPKLRSVAYTEEGDFKRGDKGRRKNYDEFYQDEDPTDIVEESRTRIDDERIKFEEDNFTRLPDENPKKAKRKLKTKEYKRSKKKFKGRR